MKWNEITKDLFEKAVVTLWNRSPGHSVIVGATVYTWLLEQKGNPVPMHQYEKNGKSPYMMRIIDIVGDQHCQLLPLIVGFHSGKLQFDHNLLGIHEHNFSDQIDFQLACADLGLVGFATVRDGDNYMWHASEPGNPKPLITFNSRNGKFQFNIPATGVTAERIHYMSMCSKLMTKAYFKDAA